MQRIQTIVLIVLVAFFTGVGIQHFVDPSPFLQIMPPPLEPWALELVYVSGFFEILGGVGLAWKRTRKAAACGLLALLVAVYPANIHMLVNEVYIDGMAKDKWLLWARLPMQFVMALGVAWTGGIWPKSHVHRH